MNLPSQISQQFKSVYYGGNWTVSNLKEHISNITWQQAITKVGDFNTIATLVYHIHYFVVAATNVLQDLPLDSKDELSFNHPPIACDSDWNQFLDEVFTTGDLFINLLNSFPEDKIWQTFVDEKYGNYYRNFQGIIEHTHYHLGQIAFVKKLVLLKEMGQII